MPVAEQPGDELERLRTELGRLYGPGHGEALEAIVAAVARRAQPAPLGAADPPQAPRAWTERDAILITYPDQVRAPGEAPLATLDRFLRDRLAGVVTAVHLLPISPWSSDDGYAVIDYASVDPALGGWDDVARLAGEFEVMLDVVMNHVSSRHEWLAGFLADDPDYQRHFIEVAPGTDLTTVVRPRATPLVTRFPSPRGERRLWTTFSADQVDLNYHEPRVLARMAEVVMADLEHGASLLRLDAVGYTWKELGTSCLNLPGAHRLVRVIRAIVDAVAPGAAVVTETNVPQPDNVAYFGHGAPEAQAVYRFALPPVVLHALLFGTAERIAPWLASLDRAPPGCAFINMLATHDGIGLMPAHGILPEGEITAMVDRVVRHGGLVTMRDTPFGPRPYELNATLFDALSDPTGGEPEDLRIARHLAANAIMLSLSGIPGVYVHSLFGSANDRAAADETGIARRINRRRFAEAGLNAALDDPSSRAARVLAGFERMLRARASHAAFRPDAPQAVLDAPPGVLAVERSSDDSGRVRTLVNLTAAPLEVSCTEGGADLLSERTAAAGEPLLLGPYEVVWLALD